MTRTLILIVFAILLSSCLRTRADIETTNQPYGAGDSNAVEPVKKVPFQSKSMFNAKNTQVSNSSVEQELARVQINQQNLGNQLRDVIGRMDIAEKHLSELSLAYKNTSIEEKLKNYQTALLNLEEEVEALKGGVSASGKQVEGVKGTISNGEKTTSFERGEAKFKNKDWKGAVQDYQLYREKFPKGKNYSEATYKIGVCFQELNLKEEAKAFYQEAVQRFPKTNAAKKAKYRLKQL